MNISLKSTLAEAIKTLTELGAASLKCVLRNDAEKPLAFVFVVRGKAESEQCEAALNLIEESWHNGALGTASVVWHDPARILPDDDTTVLVAAGDGETYEGYRDSGSWYYSHTGATDRVEMQGVYAWADMPAAPKKPTAKRKRGGT